MRGRNMAEFGPAKIAIVLGVLGVVLSSVAVGLVFTRAPATRTVAFTVTIDEGLIVTGWNNTCQCAVEIDSPAADTEKVVGEYVRWAPSVIIVNAGDTVRLRVQKPRGGDHSFAIEAAAGWCSGTTVSGNGAGRDNTGH